MIIRPLIGASLLLLATAALAQGMPGGGGGGGGPPGGGGGGPSGGPGEGPGGGPPGGARPRPPRMISLDRDDFDEAVTAMFRQADTNRNGKATVSELNAILAEQRARIVSERFRAVDADRNGAITVQEFDAWQQRLGMAALEERTSRVYDYVALPDVIGPPSGNSAEDRLLAMLIRPLNTQTLIRANADYDEGASLAELLLFERTAFDGADDDGNGVLSPDEIGSLRTGRGDCGPPARGAGMPPPPGGLPEGCETGDTAAPE